MCKTASWEVMKQGRPQCASPTSLLSTISAKHKDFTFPVPLAYWLLLQKPCSITPLAFATPWLLEHILLTLEVLFLLPLGKWILGKPWQEQSIRVNTRSQFTIQRLSKLHLRFLWMSHFPKACFMYLFNGKTTDESGWHSFNWTANSTYFYSDRYH